MSSLTIAAERVPPVIRRTAWARPEWPLAAFAGAAWVLLGWKEAAAPAGHHGSAYGLDWWLVMTVAMMLPATLPLARWTGRNSLWARRHRGPALFALAYVAVWAAFGAVALGAWSLVDGAVADVGISAAAAALLVAGAWQLGTPHRRCLKRCHRTLPLAARGSAADRSCLRYGAYHAAQCIGVCWPVMLALVPGHQLALMVALTALTSWERLAARPRRHLCACALAALAVLTAATGPGVSGDRMPAARAATGGTSGYATSAPALHCRLSAATARRAEEPR